MNPIDGLIFAFAEEIWEGIKRLFRMVFGNSGMTAWQRFYNFVKVVGIFMLIMITFVFMALISQSGESN